MSNTITAINRRPIVWRDKDGVLHLVEGADIHPGVRLLWPRCGNGDVPAGQAWLRRGEPIECPKCREIEHEMGMKAWHDRQMAKPFDERNFE